MDNVKPKSMVKISKSLTKKDDRLELDNENFKPSKLRSELYDEMKKGEKVVSEEDLIKFSHPVVRGVGLLLDGAFIYALVKLSFLFAPVEKTIHYFFLDKYKLQFILPEAEHIKMFIGLNIFIGLFFFVVLPVVFFNASFGKKLTGQRVRGAEKYTLSVSQIFKRELIFKPLGILLLVGLVMPFFDKKKQSFHDKVAKTIVVAE